MRVEGGCDVVTVVSFVFISARQHGLSSSEQLSASIPRNTLSSSAAASEKGAPDNSSKAHTS
jgi:hypothetical protein